MLQSTTNNSKNNNVKLIENYNSLEKLYTSIRFGDFVMTNSGTLRPFNEEEEKFKISILKLEEEKKTLIEKINNLVNEIKVKDEEIE